jgi:predicted NBD/HSP70 family sugar kinase
MSYLLAGWYMKYVNISQTLNPSMQHIINQSAIFHYLRENGPTYRTNIARSLDISLPAVRRALDALLGRGFVELTAYKKNDLSRTVPYYRITLMEDVMVSVDLLKGIIAAFDTEKMFALHYFKLPLKRPLIDELSEVIEYYFSHIIKKNVQTMKSICVGSPGIVDIKRGIVIKAIYHPKLEHVPIRDQLYERYKCIVFIENVVNVAAFANYWEFDKNYRNIVSLDIGLEIGAGLIIGGLVYHGEDYIAGETGFFIDDPDHPEINYKRICTFRKLCAEAVMNTGDVSVDPADLDEEFCLETISALFQSVHENDPAACALIDDYIRRIVLMLNKIDILLNPKVIVLGGDICQMPHSEEVFLRRLKERYRPLKVSGVEICYSRYGPLVTLQGGGAMALENYLCDHFPYTMENEKILKEEIKRPAAGL